MDFLKLLISYMEKYSFRLDMESKKLLPANKNKIKQIDFDNNKIELESYLNELTKYYCQIVLNFTNYINHNIEISFYENFLLFINNIVDSLSSIPIEYKEQTKRNINDIFRTSKFNSNKK